MTLANVILFALALPVALATGYLVLLSLLSRRSAAPAQGRPHLPFDLVVPAHDEALGIAGTIASLSALDYPRHLYRILVVADNCTDDTESVARAAGAQVLVRTDPSRRGKGYALACAFEQVVADGRASAVVVVDADTLVSPNLLGAFAAHLDRGATALQADYAIRNPDASWRTRLMTIAFAAVHTLRSLGRERIRVSCGLRGNGMCFTRAVLTAVPYDAFSIVEDLEYTIRLGAAGVRVHYVPEAHVYGEMPAGERESRTQRRRWEAGRADMVRRHVAPLLRRAARLRDRVSLDLAADLLVPPLATIVLLTALGLAAATSLSWQAGGIALGTWPWLGCALGLATYGLRGWQLSGTGVRGLVGLLFVPIYVGWKLALRLRRSAHPKGEWVRTAREGEQLR